jgi:hypothetical protein
LGQAVTDQYGTIQVKVVTAGGQIRSVAFAKLEGAYRQSLQSALDQVAGR